MADSCGLHSPAVQSNTEGELIDAVQQAGRDEVDYIIHEPGGLHAYQRGAA